MEHDLFRKPVSTFRDRALAAACQRRRKALRAAAVDQQALPEKAPVPGRATAFPLFALALLIALKLGVLAALGPAMTLDGGDYVTYADAILDGSFRHVDLAASAMPITANRVIGYPAVIAAAKLAAGKQWTWAVVLLQFAVSLGATVMVYRLARAFRLGPWASLGVATAQATAMQYVVDQAIASDSLCGSVMTIAACVLGIHALRRRRTGVMPFVAAGILIAAAFLIRNVIAYMAVGLTPLAIAAAMTERTAWRRLAACGLVFIPLVVAHQAYTAWNRSRLGAAMVTTIAGPALIGALAEAARYDPTIFPGVTPIDQAGRQALKTVLAGKYGYEVEAANILHNDFGWDAVKIAREGTAAYLAAWRDHPLAMIRHALQPFSETQLHQQVRATETVRDVLLWTTGSDHDFARDSAIRNGEWWMIPAIVAHRVIETLSIAIFAAFIVITPLRLIREGLTAETAVSLGLWCAYVVVTGLYAAVNLVPRYLTPVVPGSIVVGAVNIGWLVAAYRARAAAKRAMIVPERPAVARQ
jgi:hypothetical protein